MKRFIITSIINMSLMLLGFFIAGKINGDIPFYASGLVVGALCMAVEEVARRS